MIIKLSRLPGFFYRYLNNNRDHAGQFAKNPMAQIIIGQENVYSGNC
ncbi:hypothetical protein [Pedobacter suwonensis]|nr:hypothetical protein [uncultured Pedobacter sp.]